MDIDEFTKLFERINTLREVIRCLEEMKRDRINKIIASTVLEYAKSHRVYDIAKLSTILEYLLKSAPSEIPPELQDVIPEIREQIKSKLQNDETYQQYITAITKCMQELNKLKLRVEEKLNKLVSEVKEEVEEKTRKWHEDRW